MSDPRACGPFRVRVPVPAEPAIVRVSTSAAPAVIRRVQRGEMGASGADAYAVWLAAGYTGTRDDFLTSLRGDPSGAHTTEFHQAAPSATWTIGHNLRRYPSVTLVDSAGDEFTGDKRYVDENTIVVTLTAPVSGTAYLN